MAPQRELTSATGRTSTVKLGPFEDRLMRNPIRTKPMPSISRLREELDIPVTHVIVDPDRAPVPTTQ